MYMVKRSPPPVNADPFRLHLDEPTYVPPTADDFDRLDGIEVIRRLVALHGAARVMRWVQFLAELPTEAI